MRKFVIVLSLIKKVKWSRYRPGVAQRVGRGIALLFHDRSTRRGWVVSSTPRSHFTSRKDPVPILQEAGWAPGPVWTGWKSRPHRYSIPDRPPIVSRYTDWATPSPLSLIRLLNRRGREGVKYSTRGKYYTILEGFFRKKIVEFDVAGIILDCVLKKEFSCMWIAFILLKANSRANMLWIQ